MEIFFINIYLTYILEINFYNWNKKIHRERIYLSLYDCSHLRSYKYDQTPIYIFDQYVSYVIDHVQLFRSSSEENGNPIKEDWSKIGCKQFDNFSESLGFETASTIIERSFSYTSTSSFYNTKRKHFMWFVRVIEDIF